MATQMERRATTQGVILAAAQDLFGRQGFSATTVDQIAAAAGVAKGAIYHHFPTKEALFEQVFRETSADLAADLAKGVISALDPVTILSQGVRAYFAACADGPTGQIILKDAPVVLGWERWREVDVEYFGGFFPINLDAAMKAGLIGAQPVEPLARLFLGAVSEAAAACNASADPAATSRDYASAIEALLEGLRVRQP